jgi:hypothetical protein
MEQQAIHNYLHTFFTLNKCNIEDNQDGRLTVKLNEELDRLLLNRPFYWEYIKKMGQEGEPASLTFISNPNLRESEGEWIHFGSPRLHQIFQSQLSQGKYTVVYENQTQTALKPWLVTNVLISYKGRQKKEELLSVGLNLINGAMVFEFMEKSKGSDFSNMIPDYSFTISPIIRVPSAYKRIENFLAQYIDEQDHQWAEDAFAYFQKEKNILTHFYESYLENADDEEKENLTTRYQSEIEHLQKRLLPQIQTEIVNGGIFYLSEETTNEFLRSH